MTLVTSSSCPVHVGFARKRCDAPNNLLQDWALYALPTSGSPHLLRGACLTVSEPFWICLLACIQDIAVGMSRGTSLPRICGMGNPRWRLAFWRAASTRSAASSLWALVMPAQRCRSATVLPAMHSRCNVPVSDALTAASEEETAPCVRRSLQKTSRMVATSMRWFRGRRCAASHSLPSLRAPL